MNAETAFLEAVETYLGEGSLAPTPQQIGDLEPTAPGDLPAVVLSLEEMSRKGSGLGRRSNTIEGGALPWSSAIDLADPVLPTEPDFSLLSEDRLVLILPHGGLVKLDGTAGQLATADLTITVAGVPRPVVVDTPTGDQVRADALTGTLTFATPLPGTGLVEAHYFLGSWEQRLVRLSGRLRVDVCAGVLNDLRSLSNAVMAALAEEEATGGIDQLLTIDASGIGAILPPASEFANARRQSLRFSFTYEHQINRPESSGGIIQRVPLVAHVSALLVDKKTGTIEEAVETESDLETSP